MEQRRLREGSSSESLIGTFEISDLIAVLNSGETQVEFRSVLAIIEILPRQLK
jgi:hypothetical protein